MSKAEYVKVIYLGKATNTGELLCFYAHKKKGDSHVYDSAIILSGTPQKEYPEAADITNDVDVEYRNGWVAAVKFKEVQS